MQAVVKKWLREKEYGFLDNGSGPDIMIRKADLVRCQFLKAGTTVEFECHPDKGGLIAKNVRLIRQNAGGQGYTRMSMMRTHCFSSKTGQARMI